MHAFREVFGPRTVLSALAADGLSDMYEYSRDPRFYEYLEFRPHMSIDETAAYLEELRRRGADGTAYYWFIRLKSSMKVIGTFGVHSIDWRRRAAEIGYGLAPDFWGAGYFAEVLSIVLPYLFGDVGLHRIAATTIADNTASVKALERAGFVREGRLRDYYLYADGRRADAVVLGALAPSRF